MIKTKWRKRAMIPFAVLAAVAMTATATASTLSSVALAAENANETAKFYSDYDSMDEAKSAAERLTEELASEGDVLLKNANNALPMSGSSKVSVFGVTSDNLVGASDSSGAFGSTATSSQETVADALEEAGFIVNPTLKNFYAQNTNKHGDEVTEDEFSGKAKQSLSAYNDAAIIVLSREGGEGSDASTTTAAHGSAEEAKEDDGTHKALYTDKDGKQYKHSLMLTDSEQALVKYVESNFDKVIVVLNTSNIMEVDCLKEDSQVDAIVHIGRPGVGGLAGLAGILNGTYNPSGRLVDEWMADFTSDPTWYNFGNNAQTGSSNEYLNEAGNSAYAPTGGGMVKSGIYGVDYEESIYLGYKYYETYYQDIYYGRQAIPEGYTSLSKEEAAQKWWADNVTYPFGYGLSYTSFSMNVKEMYYNNGTKTTVADGANLSTALFDSAAGTNNGNAQVEKLYVDVDVKNTGDVAGKQVVQVYVTAPYTSGGIEKSAVTLVGYAKTDELAPGETQTVTVEFNVQDMASWDYLDANQDGSKGDYELDTGAYTVRVMENSHFDCATDVSDENDAYDEVNFNIIAATEGDKAANMKTDDFSGGELGNKFSTENGVWNGTDRADVLNYNSTRTASLAADGKAAMTQMSRSDFAETFPEAPTEADLTFNDDAIDNWLYWDEYNVDTLGTDGKAVYSDEGQVWEKTADDIPEGWTQAATAGKEGSAAIQYSDMSGVAWDDPVWDTFLNQLTYDELCQIVELGGYGTTAIASIGKAQTVDADGPNNLSSSHCWCSEDIISSTWNTELAEEQGRMVGNIALLLGTQGWYGPGMDTHRSPFSGRNNEYYSQDGIQGGYIAAAVIQGAQSKGVITYVKHCFLNDQETNRDGKVLFVWANEQTIRENYAKVFQMALQEGGSKAAMTGYARIGGIPNTGNYNLMTGLMQEEWGSKAYFVTDGYIGWQDATELDIMVRTGYQLQLYTSPFVEELSGTWDASKNTVVLADGSESPTQWYCVRQSAKAVLYGGADTTSQFNGYSTLAVAGKQMTATTGVDFEGSVAIDANQLTSGSFVEYTVSGNLPAGFELNGATGEITGTTNQAGTYTFTVNYLIDGYVEKTAQHTITVASALYMDEEGDALDSAKVGTEFMAQIKSDVFTTAGEAYDTVKYEVAQGNLPAGLTLGEDGIISGTPTEAGTFNVTIRMTATKESSGGGFPFPGGDMPFSAEVTPLADAPAGPGGPGGPGGGGFPGGGMPPFGGGGTETTTLDYEITIVVAEDGTGTGGGEEEITIDDIADQIGDLADRIDGLEQGGSQDGGDNTAALALAGVSLGVAVLAGAAAVVIAVKSRKKD
ncbi:MAG TPA: glycoside hydrolase family 3 C-terminal domain-containing protein [Candidatus Coproplasma stercorigallinarum]|nr:glycoside hydrolase family 3 C-terminal domain-containing protein [Candidatus Coproplasma stercorigallinarum]